VTPMTGQPAHASGDAWIAWSTRRVSRRTRGATCEHGELYASGLYRIHSARGAARS
jgi:hypothetical protein